LSRIAVLCGGTGSSKFAKALASQRRDNDELSFVANVGDNFWHYGLYICPDVDILIYALSDQLDRSKGWGVSSDSFVVKDRLALESAPDWFSLGDKDLTMSIRRAELIARGWTLASITELFCSLFGIKDQVIPATNDNVQTFVRTRLGSMHLQEFWVKYRASHLPTAVDYVGVDRAIPAEGLLETLKEKVIICPANPVTSIGPTIALGRVKKTMEKAKVVAVSPFIGSRPLSGPAYSLMMGLGIEPSSLGVAKMYSSFLTVLVVDGKEDQSIATKVKDLGIECVKTDTIVSDDESGKRIANELLGLL
jgi:LPPG:FO 2-phospho-L-lactate transferase